MEPQSLSLFLSVKIGGHDGCHCSHLWNQDEAIASFQLFIVVPEHFNFVSPGCEGGLKLFLLQYVPVLKFKKQFGFVKMSHGQHLLGWV